MRVIPWLAVVAFAATARAGAQCPPAWGLPPDPATWCERASSGLDLVPGTADDNPACTVNAGDGVHSPCTQVSGTQWLMREGDGYCEDCPYSFYVVVDCSTSLHVPNHDVEAMALSVVDMLTGAPVLLTVQNECAVRRDRGDPFVYCNGCNVAGGILAKDDSVGPPMNKPAGSCDADTPIGPVALPEMPCLPYRVTDFSASWGLPVDGDSDGDYDENGDGSVDSMLGPPCVTCGAPECSCTPSTNANPVTEEQVIDVVLHGSPLLSGVYRVEILSGGLEWQLYSNCDGTNTPMFPIYATCADALAAWQPKPELALHDDADVAFFVEDDALCPASVVLGVTTCNRSRGAASASVPFEITFDEPSVPRFIGDNAAHPTDPACQVPLEPGECRTCYWTVPLGAPAATGTLRLDPDFLVEECSEGADNARCGMDGRRSQTLGTCGAGFLDSDSDGLPDWRETNLGFDPRSADADGDGIQDQAELGLGTSPRSADTDGDGAADAVDTCPVTPNPSQADTDGDGIGDACEPGVRDVLAILSKLADGRMKLEWEWLDDAIAHDLAAGDLDALHATGAHAHELLACSLPLGFAGRLLDDPAGDGRSRYYLLGSAFPGPDEWGATSLGNAIPAPTTRPGCR